MSVANAKQNLESESTGWDFDAVHKAATGVWNTNLSLIEVSGGTRDELTKFYTALYRTMWAPRVFNDVNGQYLGFDGATHTLVDGQHAQYTAFSGWDVYRSLIPLQALLFPKETSDAMQSLVNFADQCGAIPHWVSNNAEIGIMPGDAGSLMIAGAHAFGARDFTTYRNTASGTKSTSSGNVYAVYYFSEPLDSSKIVARVTLPAQLSKGRMRLFGIGLAPSARLFSERGVSGHPA